MQQMINETSGIKVAVAWVAFIKRVLLKRDSKRRRLAEKQVIRETRVTGAEVEAFRKNLERITFKGLLEMHRKRGNMTDNSGSGWNVREDPKGHHYQDDAMFSSGLVTTIKNIRNRSPNAIIIYEASMIIRDAMERKSHWISCQLGVIALSLDDIHRQNLIVRGMVGSGRQDYRIDGHIGGQDCLRLCIFLTRGWTYYFIY
ncbi:6128_t:CDS:2 [Paraglomus brasilianum]|uniref:6128_t:CDS:1 n=1 Tax=Paraglomus brasilianum TaxID=144538 RepID=A0A9N9F420_9GLOM|nr:6128_t:CDS:2 [Paraglomus brasilianum]